MANFFVSPLLFWAGLIAVLSPIIIHLLNKRRFKRVDWAAMDFLLLAEKINKRRVKLEELLLLLMRCAIMALLGVLLARPFITFDSGAGFLKATRHERVIVLDDSLSMNAQSGGSSPLSEAKKTVANWVTTLASNGSSDSITLILASRPERALYRDEPLKEDSVNQLLEDVRNLETSDVAGNWLRTLDEVEKVLEPTAGASINRIVYVLSDFRKRDWASASQSDVNERLKRVSEKAAGCYLVDLGKGGGTDNLVLEAITPGDKALIAGVPSNFDITVRNAGSAPVTDVKVRLSADESLPLERVIDRIPPGETGSAPFTYTFAVPQEDASGAPAPVQLKAEISPNAGDVLAEDNVRFFPVRVVSGLDVLIVDGAPSSAYGESDAFFLTKALSPRGRTPSGINVTVMDDTEFAAADLESYQMIFIVNVYRIPEGRRLALENFVSAGGGLVWVLGDQLDEETYNSELYNNGQGLLPVELKAIAGDETAETWAYLEPVKTGHPVLRLFEGDGGPLLQGVKVFQWWSTAMAPEALDAGKVAVIAAFSDDAKSAAMVESAFGQGRVMAMTTAVDVDWNNWPMEAAGFVIAMQELTRYMARSSASEGVLTVGAPIHYDLDLTKTRPEATMVTPSGTSLPVRALPNAETGGGTVWPLSFEETQKRGFYQLGLTSTDGGLGGTVLYAANIDPSEAQLEHVPAEEIKRAIGTEVPLEVVSAGTSLMDLGANRLRSEYWRWALYALLAFLCVELFYGFWLGTRR